MVIYPQKTTLATFWANFSSYFKGPWIPRSNLCSSCISCVTSSRKQKLWYPQKRYFYCLSLFHFLWSQISFQGIILNLIDVIRLEFRKGLLLCHWNYINCQIYIYIIIYQSYIKTMSKYINLFPLNIAVLKPYFHNSSRATSRSNRKTCSVKKVFLQFRKTNRKTPQSESPFWYSCRPYACNVIKIETLAPVFSFEFCEISKNTFSYRTPQVAASELLIFRTLPNISDEAFLHLFLQKTSIVNVLQDSKYATVKRNLLLGLYQLFYK